jgi:hypothetical protein
MDSPQSGQLPGAGALSQALLVLPLEADECDAGWWRVVPTIDEELWT